MTIEPLKSRTQEKRSRRGVNRYIRQQKSWKTGEFSVSLRLQEVISSIQRFLARHCMETRVEAKDELVRWWWEEERAFRAQWTALLLMAVTSKPFIHSSLLFSRLIPRDIGRLRWSPICLFLLLLRRGIACIFKSKDVAFTAYFRYTPRTNDHGV